MPFAATWMDLEEIVLNDVSRIWKDNYYMFLYVEAKRLISKK